MPLPVIADVYRTALVWHNSFYSRDAVNVMHFRAPGGSAASVWTALDANVTAAMWGPSTVDDQVTTATITPLDGTSNSVVHNIATVARWSGAQTTGDIIPQVAALVKLTTAFRGRSHRGRLFIPFPAETKVSLGTLDGTVRTTANTAWSTFVTNMAAAGVHLCVASYKYASSSDVTGAVMENLLATQRRRQLR
jgi:hypothetical protein